MAGTLEFVLTCLPVRCTAEMGATSVNDEQPIRSLCYPDAILLLPLRVDAQRVIARRTNSKDTRWFQNRTRQEEPQEHQKVSNQKYSNGRPDDAPAHLVDWRIRSALNNSCRLLGNRSRSRCSGST